MEKWQISENQKMRRFRKANLAHLFYFLAFFCQKFVRNAKDAPFSEGEFGASFI